jgi:predicted O-linked N-acetylglucosamine transferase (SPINDLY family)
LQQALDDQPNVIFYPEIAMDPITLQLASLRLAPLQVASWGHPITTGLPTIDVYLSGELIEPSLADSHYCEQLVRLPGTGACSILPEVNVIPPDMMFFDIPADPAITRFFICQQAAKFAPEFDHIYPRIALAVERCRFWFVRDRNSRDARIVEQRIGLAFAFFGLDVTKYVRFIDWLPGEQFLGILETMDIYLDTPAFSGYTTAWQALHRGLPVVTLEGRFMRQRLAAGLLRRIGATAAVAVDLDDYVAKAAALARDPDLRKTIGQCVRDSITNTDEDLAVVRAFEAVILD